jgi:hypothetical protein
MTQDYNSELKVPCGWTKAEPLVVSRKMIHFKGAWVLEKEIVFNFSESHGAISDNHVAFIWFFTFEDMANFLKWWHE